MRINAELTASHSVWQYQARCLLALPTIWMYDISLSPPLPVRFVPNIDEAALTYVTRP